MIPHKAAGNQKDLLFCGRTVLETVVCMCQIRAPPSGAWPAALFNWQQGQDWGLSCKRSAAKRGAGDGIPRARNPPFRYSGELRKDRFWELDVAPIVGEFLLLIWSGKDLDLFEPVLEICPWGPFALWALFSRDLNLNATLADGLQSGPLHRRPSAHLLLTSASIKGPSVSPPHCKTTQRGPFISSIDSMITFRRLAAFWRDHTPESEIFQLAHDLSLV
jgi:hypothetical protein